MGCFGDAVPISVGGGLVSGSQGSGSLEASSSGDFELLHVLHEELLGEIGGWHASSSRSSLWILGVLWEWKSRASAGVVRHVILSKGHASPALYAVLAHHGVIGREELFRGFSRPGGCLQSHPVRGLPGVVVSSGSLGQGLSIANGLALASRVDGVRREVAVVVGDGELDEGMVWEALASASSLGLDNVLLVVDRNLRQLSGPTEEVKRKEPLRGRLESFGWVVEEAVNEPGSIRRAVGRLEGVVGRGPRALIVWSSRVVDGGSG